MTESLIELALPVIGMTCASCTSHVDEALKVLPGVSDVATNLSTNRVHLRYDPAQSSVKDMVHAVEEVGYLIMTSEVTLNVKGMTCASCVNHVESALTELPGVESAVVNLGLGTARVKYVPGSVFLSAMKKAVEDA